MKPTRRQFLAGTALAAATSREAAARRSRVAQGLTAPLLSDDQVLRYVAGVRPYRRTGPRIERQEAGGKVVVHNYGHGGAGYTLSWGSASEAADRTRACPGIVAETAQDAQRRSGTDSVTMRWASSSAS